MRVVRWVLVGLAIVFAFAAAIRSARIHSTGTPERDDAAAGRPAPVRENWAERKTGEAPLPSARQAPEFPRADADGWINSPPLSMGDLRGKVVVLDVWTFG